MQIYLTFDALPEKLWAMLDENGIKDDEFMLSAGCEPRSGSGIQKPVEQRIETLHNRGVPGANRNHLAHLTIEQFGAVIFRENSGLTHPFK